MGVGLFASMAFEIQRALPPSFCVKNGCRSTTCGPLDVKSSKAQGSAGGLWLLRRLRWCVVAQLPLLKVVRAELAAATPLWRSRLLERIWTQPGSRVEHGEVHPHCGHGHAQHLCRPTAHKAGRHVSGTLVGTVLEHCIAGLNGVAAEFFSVTMCCWQTFGQEALEGTSEAVSPSFWKPSFFLPSSAGGTSGQVISAPSARAGQLSRTSHFLFGFVP